MTSVWGWHVIESIICNNSRKIFKIETLKIHEKKIIEILKKQKIPIEFVDVFFLEKQYGKNTQGIVMHVSEKQFLCLKDWISKQTNKSFLLACDLIVDCQNLGAIIRTCRAFGANGVLVTKKNCAPFNGTLAKASAGALETLDIIKVSNLATALRVLKDNDYTIYGLDHRGLDNISVTNRNVVVLGQEAKGLRNLTKRCCDRIIRIKTQNDFCVLNVSVAAGIIVSKFLGG